jgi:hypothetical protein
MDSTAHATSRLECGFVTTKFKPFTRIAASESVRTCLEILRRWDRQDLVVLIIKQQVGNMHHFLLNVSEWTFHSSEDMLLVGITYRLLKKSLQLLDFLGLGRIVVSTKLHPVLRSALLACWRT